jgi:hypothetical protein
MAKTIAGDLQPGREILERFVQGRSPVGEDETWLDTGARLK